MAAPSHLWISYIELQNAEKVESAELLLGNSDPRRIPKQQEGIFREGFAPYLRVDYQEFSITLRRSRLGFNLWRKGTRRILFSRHDVLSDAVEHEYRKEDGKLVIIIGCPTQSVSTDTFHMPSDSLLPPAPANEPGSLRPTTEEVLQQCPRFRILVIGKSGVGKSSLINRAFGIEKALVASDRPGEANIDQELISSQNDRFILHDSRGFESGDGGNYNAMKTFIESRKRQSHVKDQLHAVWLCFQVPLPGHGERLIERSAEQFWKEKSEILGNIPTIVVFTKYDKLVNIMKLRSPDDPQLEAERHLRTNCIQPIQNFSGEENISHMALPPANKGYEQGQKDLIQLTFEKVLERFTPQQNGPSPVPVVTLMAQRVSPRLNIKGSIQVGKQRYWRAIAASPNFEGYTIRDCLHVIHTDIISVWNFYDPDNCLTSEQFRDYMLDMIADIGDIGLSETHTKADDEVDIEQCGLSLITLLPITLPFTAGAKLVRWVSETYQRIPNIQQKFIVYIVDLTHILEILFALTANNSAKKLTRRSIKIAYKAYLESSLKRTIHSDVRDFHGAGIITGGRDLILEKIELFLQTSYTSDVPLSRVLSKVPQASLDMDEEWST